MIQLRVRPKGSEEWTYVTIDTPGNTDETSEMEKACADQLEARMLEDDSAEIQRLDWFGEWEEVE